MSAAAIKATWARIEAWLAAKAPAVLAALNDEATDAQIAEAERTLGVTFPDDLLASYRRHNGQGREIGFLAGVALVDLETIISDWTMWKNLLDKGVFDGSLSTPTGPIRPETGPIRPDWWNPRWIPLTRNQSGDHYCLDLDPAPGGTVGQIITMWHDDPEREVVAPSYGAWFVAFADELDAGKWTTHRSYDDLIATEDAEAEDEPR
jgi:cell wall assembly regulator SMI1